MAFAIITSTLTSFVSVALLALKVDSVVDVGMLGNRAIWLLGIDACVDSGHVGCI